MLFSYCPTTRLSFLQPSSACYMQKRQASDVAPRHGFSAGDIVWCLNQQLRGNNNWLKGVIRTRIGPLTYAVSCHGRLRHTHVEHLRPCKIATTPEFSSSSDQPSQQPVVLSRSSDSPLSQPSSNSLSSAPFPQPPSSSDASSPPPASPPPLHCRLFQQRFCVFFQSVFRYCHEFLCLLNSPRLFHNVNDPLDKSDHLKD